MIHSFATLKLESQTDRYREFYSRGSPLRALVRFDIRYRCRRLAELIAEHGLHERSLSVLEMGFGGGELLCSLPKRWSLTGAEISVSAVRSARADPRYLAFPKAHFVQIAEHDPDTLPPGPFDIVLSSHVLEHVLSEEATLEAMRRRLAPGGYLILFVPIEEPDYIRFHRRQYSLQTIAERVSRAGFSVTSLEGSMHINGHLWKLLTVPSRRQWPVLGPIVDAVRCGVLSVLPYRSVRMLDGTLDAFGFGPRQALVVARCP